MKKRKGCEGNPVFKNMESFNKPKTFRDRKKRKKKGYIKHKSCILRDFSIVTIENILMSNFLFIICR